MPRPSKGARLVWRDEYRKADGSLDRAAGWFIEDRGRRKSTGCDRSQLEEAERQLQEYLAAKFTPTTHVRNRDPHTVLIASAIDLYAAEVAPDHADPAATAARLVSVNAFFGQKTFADITGSLCRRFADQCSTPAAARRRLEDLRAAMKHYYSEGYVTAVPAIVMPPKAEGRVRWLTREEAARLLRAAWRMRQTWKGKPSDRRTGQHVARFVLVALYTGTRSGAVVGAATRPTPGHGFIDYERGVFFRRAEGKAETKKRQPAVRLPDRLLAHMRRWAATEHRIKTEARCKSLNVGRMISHDFVVEWEGGPVKSVKKAFAAAVKAAGLGWYDEAGGWQTDVTPHVLRHTAATWLMQNGTPLSIAADYLGMTEAVLRAVYWHHHPDFQAEASARITEKAPRPRAEATNVVRLR